MFQLAKQFTFEAAHRLPNHDGLCRRLHGHSWVGHLIVRGNELEQVGAKQGMLIDFHDLSAVIDPIVEQYLDHHYLNETLPLDSPTSEEIARWVYQQVKPKLPCLHAVVINETCTSSCEYSE